MAVLTPPSQYCCHLSFILAPSQCSVFRVIYLKLKLDHITQLVKVSHHTEQQLKLFWTLFLYQPLCCCLLSAVSSSDAGSSPVPGLPQLALCRGCSSLLLCTLSFCFSLVPWCSVNILVIVSEHIGLSQLSIYHN